MTTHDHQQQKASRHPRAARRWSPVTQAVRGKWTRGDDAPADVPDEAGMAIGKAGDRAQGVRWTMLTPARALNKIASDAGAVTDWEGDGWSGCA